MDTPDKKCLLTALAGSLGAAVLFALASPPFGYAPVAWLVPGLLLVTAGRLPLRHAFESGLLFGVISAGLVIRWLPESLAVGFELSPLTASLIVYGGITLAVGVPFGLLALVYAFASRRVSRVDLPIIGAFFWVTGEWVRAQFFGWQLLGHTQFREIWLIQVADLGGVLAVSFVLAFASIAVAELLRTVATRGVRFTAAAHALLLPIATLAIAFVYGAVAQETYRPMPAAASSAVGFSEGAFAAPIRAVGWTPPAAPSWPELHIREVATIDHVGLRVSPLLCEDLLRTDIVHGVVGDGADVLINNCRVAWLADSSSAAAEQHLALAVFRAVESRRFLIRATNQGEGELITALGETHSESPRGQTLTISSHTSRYMEFGDHWILVGFGVSLIAIGRKRRH